MPELKTFSNQRDSIGFLVSEYVELMKTCWSEDYRKRPSFDTVLNCLELIRRQMLDITEKRHSKHSSQTQNYFELVDVSNQ